MKKSKKILLLGFLLVLHDFAFAQNYLSIKEKLGKTCLYKVNCVDSIIFESEEKNSISNNLIVFDKSGQSSNYLVSDIDSIYFIKKTLSNKNGFVIIRVDDNHPSSEILPMANLLEKYGFRLVNAFNPGAATKDMVSAVKVLYSHGHEIVDHTPQHTTSGVYMRTKAQVNRFIGMPGVEKIEGLMIYLDWIYPELEKCIVLNDSIETIAGSSYIKKNNSTLTTSDLIFTSEFGWVLLKNINTNKATVIHPKSHEELFFKKSAKEQLYKCDSYSTFITEDGLKSLMLASQLWFEDLGLNYYKYWCMCGGNWAIANSETIRNAGIQMGYLGGSTHSNDGNIPMTYNQSNTLSRWATQIQTISTEATPSNELKRFIANEVAKHRGLVDLSHMGYKCPAITTLFSGTDEEKFVQYLKNLEDVLKFCYENEIPVLTYKEANEVLYDSVSNPNINVLPPLYVDLTSQGYPDGYTLNKKTVLVDSIGVSEDRFHSLEINGNGFVFKINNIGGFEKGENIFSFYSKASTDVVLTLVINSAKGGKILEKISIPVYASGSFVKYSKVINIPNDFDLFNVEVSVSNNDNNDFCLSGMYIGKEYYLPK